MWTGDRHCPRCGQPRSQAVPAAPRHEAVAPAWSAAQHDDDPAPWQTSSAVTTAQQERDAPPPRPGRRRKNGALVAAAALLVVAVLVAGTVLWRTGALGGDTESAAAAPAPTASEPAGDPTPADEPSEGAVERLPTTGDSLVEDARAQVPSTSDDATDGNGDTTSYEAANMLDGDPETTWRMDGDGSGESVTFTFDGERTISQLGLINGYAKTDPASGADRYAQTRRITRVTWTIGADSFEQRLDDGDQGLQPLAIRPVKGDEVTLEIDRVTRPGDSSFNQTAISEVEILG